MSHDLPRSPSLPFLLYGLPIGLLKQVKSYIILQGSKSLVTGYMYLECACTGGSVPGPQVRSTAVPGSLHPAAGAQVYLQVATDTGYSVSARLVMLLLSFSVDFTVYQVLGNNEPGHLAPGLCTTVLYCHTVTWTTLPLAVPRSVSCTSTATTSASPLWPVAMSCSYTAPGHSGTSCFLSPTYVLLPLGSYILTPLVLCLLCPVSCLLSVFPASAYCLLPF